MNITLRRVMFSEKGQIKIQIHLKHEHPMLGMTHTIHALLTDTHAGNTTPRALHCRIYKHQQTPIVDH